MQKKYFYCLGGLIGALLLGKIGTAQIAVNGAACTIAGGGNGVSYSVSGPVQPSDHLSWQITGGVIVGAKSSTLSGQVSSIGSQVRVLWTTNAKTGSIQVTDDKLGTNILSVTVVSMASGITPATSAIKIGSPLSITGGGPDNSCAAVYKYWWEIADSASGPFMPIDSLAGQHLLINSVLKKGYYRRVICSNGENIYSNVVFIDLVPLN